VPAAVGRRAAGPLPHEKTWPRSVTTAVQLAPHPIDIVPITVEISKKTSLRIDNRQHAADMLPDDHHWKMIISD
jgi:hypothetical protein